MFHYCSAGDTRFLLPVQETLHSTSVVYTNLSNITDTGFLSTSAGDNGFFRQCRRH